MNRISDNTTHTPLFGKLFETYLSVVEGKFTDVEQHCNQCIQFALHRWSNLPPLSSTSTSHVSLLRFFHQLVEVHEAGQVMVEVHSLRHGRAEDGGNGSGSGSAGRAGSARVSLPDLKQVMQTWRGRLPNDWDALSEWSDLLAWRQWVFKTTADAFRGDEVSYTPCINNLQLFRCLSRSPPLGIASFTPPTLALFG